MRKNELLSLFRCAPWTRVCFAFLIRERTEELAANITLEQGKTLAGEEEMQGMQVDWFARLMDP